MKITIETQKGGREFIAVIWSKDPRGSESPARDEPVFFTNPSLNVEDAKLKAERAFGLLDWGNGGQPDNEASVGIDY
jgi:hypothetical protein